jgi:hypothetical protein
MKNSAFYFSAALISLLSILVNPSFSKSTAIYTSSSVYSAQQKLTPFLYVIDTSSIAACRPDKVMDDCSVTGILDNIAGDTYAVKFTNTCDDDYRVYYQVIDGDKTIQDTSSAVVRAHSSNSSGTLHCSSNAYIKIIKREISK